ncbi:MAG: thioredoxin fold domain-containing protein [Bacteroidetes bacterium]|nr:thioredoxin fold domain-containing protein [Bacteroidota bacterium]
MTRFSAALAVLLFLAAVPAVAQTAADYPEDSPNWLPMEDAVASAQNDGDIVLIHAYATWCGWCRELDATTYTDDAVQAYLAEHFEVTRLDIESPESINFFGGQVPMSELGEALGVRSTPTTIFMDSDGSYMTHVPSYIPPERFILVLRYVRERAFEMMEFPDYAEMIEASEG